MWYCIYTKYWYSGTCVIRHTLGQEKNDGLSRLSEYSGFFCKNRHILGPWKCFGWSRMLEYSSGTELVRLHCTNYYKVYNDLNITWLMHYNAVISSFHGSFNLHTVMFTTTKSQVNSLQLSLRSNWSQNWKVKAETLQCKGKR